MTASRWYRAAHAGWPDAEQSVGALVLRLATVLFALLVVGALALQIYQFDGRNYRDDEIRTVHAGLTLSPSEVVQWMSVDIHPPFWRVLGALWVSAFGPTESIVRFQSTLFAALALALLYRHAADLFDRRVALLAVFLLGTHAVFIFYAHEFRPYAALLMWVLALHFSFVRWLLTRRFLYAVLYLLCAAAALYTHFFAAYAIAGQVVALLLLVRWDRRLYVRAFGLWLAVGLAFTGWLPSFLHSFLVTKPGGIGYSLPLDDPGTPGLLFDTFQLRPYVLGSLFVGVALLTPLARILGRDDKAQDTARFRLGVAWRKWYWVIVAITVVVGALLTDTYITKVVTQRNFIVLLPALVLLAALGLRALPWQAALVALPLLLNPAVRNFADFQSNQPYQEVQAFIAQEYQPGSPIVVSVDQGNGRYFAYDYYLLDTLPGSVSNDDFFNLTLGGPPVNLPDTDLSHITGPSPAEVAQFDALIAAAAQVYWISSNSAPDYAQTYRDALLQAGFVVTRSERYYAYGSAYAVEAYTRADSGG